MDTERKYSLEEKIKIAVEEAKVASGNGSVNEGMLLTEVFPNTDENANEEEASEGDGERLEFLINLEMKLTDGNFRINANHFFDQTLTVGRFATIVHEAEEQGEDQSIEELSHLTDDESESLDGQEEPNSKPEEEQQNGDQAF